MEKSGSGGIDGAASKRDDERRALSFLMQKIKEINEGNGAGNPAQIKLEKVAEACKRMAMSRAQLYREISAGRIRLVKLGVRSSAVLSSDVDEWIINRINSGAKK